MNRLKFILGEKRRIWLEITTSDKDSENFMIRNAKYELRLRGEEEAAGECTVQDHQIIAVVQPQQKGQYELIYTFQIGDEILKEDVTIIVE